MRLPSGTVHGLQLSASVEPEAACGTATLHVPRLVAPFGAQPTALTIPFNAACHLLDSHTASATAALDTAHLLQAYALLDALCQQYLRDAVHALPASAVPTWHHKLLHTWCSRQQSPPVARTVAPSDVRAADPDVWAEVQLAERCGARLADALSGVVAYQELLFPGGSMEAVLPVYEHAVLSAFYNACVVAAIEAVLSLLAGGRRVLALEVGAGPGGTASSVLPVLDGACERYVFTDV